jgi:GNAT superfamily N-acetyltransferase
VEHARPATLADIPTLQRLWELCIAEIAGQRGGSLLAGTLPDSGSPAAFLTRAIDDAERLVILGCTEDVEVGFACVRCDRSGRDPIGVVELIYVEPSARLVGVGEAILQTVVSWCAELGCCGVDAPALPGNRAAKAFFEDHGFVARLLIMHQPLPLPSDRERG